jgi:hypothetical protein
MIKDHHGRRDAAQALQRHQFFARIGHVPYLARLAADSIFVTIANR